MNERIKELAEQAGLVTTWEGWVSTHQEHAEGVSDEFLERFAELVRQDEREAWVKKLNTMIIGCVDVINEDGVHEDAKKLAKLVKKDCYEILRSLEEKNGE